MANASKLMPLTSIPVDSKVRDRLKGFGTMGETYNVVLTRLMDQADREQFFREIRRELDDPTTAWIDAEDL
jgi:hypothetical protein